MGSEIEKKQKNNECVIFFHLYTTFQWRKCEADKINKKLEKRYRLNMKKNYSMHVLVICNQYQSHIKKNYSTSN